VTVRAYEAGIGLLFWKCSKMYFISSSYRMARFGYVDSVSLLGFVSHMYLWIRLYNVIGVSTEKPHIL